MSPDGSLRRQGINNNDIDLDETKLTRSPHVKG